MPVCTQYMYVIDEIEGSNVANLIRSFITKKTLENVNILKKKLDAEGEYLCYKIPSSSAKGFWSKILLVFCYSKLKQLFKTIWSISYFNTFILVTSYNLNIGGKYLLIN